LRPVAVVDDGTEYPATHGVALCPSACTDQMISFGVRHALIVAPELPQSQLLEIIRRQGEVFPHLIIIPGIDGICNGSSRARDVLGVLTVQVRNNLLHRGSQIAKRLIDLVLCVLSSVVLLPFLALISILIALESKGPILYSQRRVGHSGRVFEIWKFRTMVNDASAVLQRYLDNSPELREEWAKNHKLRNDPRVTRIGALLRKTSLDELPQFWNVLKGEMSLVGPRPHPLDDFVAYDIEDLSRLDVTPGITGLWQVSGRSEVFEFEDVIFLDRQYIEQWSFWLDISILFRTIPAVLRRTGAY